MALIKAYLIDLKYIVEDHVAVELYCRSEDGALLIIRDYYRPNFSILPIRETDRLALRQRIARLRTSEHEFVTGTAEYDRDFRGSVEQFIKVFVSRPDAIPSIKAAISSWDATQGIFEDDITLTKKYLLEQRVTPFSLFEAEVTTMDPRYGLPCFKLLSLFKNRDILMMQPKVASLSLAKNHYSDEIAIASVGIHVDSLTHVLSWKSKEGSNEFLSGEAELISRLREILHDAKPDILLFEHHDTGLSTILERARKYRIRFDINFDGTEPFMNDRTGRIRTVGCNEVSLRELVSTAAGLSLEEFSIEEVYANMLDALVLASTDSDEGLNIYVNERCTLNARIFSELEPSLSELLRLVGLRVSDLLSCSLPSLLDWMLVRECLVRGHVLPSRTTHYRTQSTSSQLDTGSQQFSPGATVTSVEGSVQNDDERSKFVCAPKPGVYDSVSVFNMIALYSEVIIRENISPDTFHCNCCKDEFCRKHQGILPILLVELLSRIKRIETAYALNPSPLLDGRRKLISRILESVVLFVDSERTRWYSPALSTNMHAGVAKRVKSIVERLTSLGNIIYADDAILLMALYKDKDETLKTIDILYPQELWTKPITFHERFLLLPFSQVAKKRRLRYAALNGEEYHCGNLTPRYGVPKYATDLAEHLAKAILGGISKDMLSKYLLDELITLREHRVDLQKLIIRSRLVKPLEAYPEKTMQHTIMLALKKKGITSRRNDLIEYLIADVDEPYSKRARLMGDFKGLTYDAHYYEEKIVLPILEDLLFVIGLGKPVLHKKEDHKDSPAQSRLGEFIR